MTIDGVNYKSNTLTVLKINRSTEEAVFTAPIEFNPTMNKFELGLTSVVVPTGTPTVLTVDTTVGGTTATLNDVTGLQSGQKLQFRMVKDGVTYESPLMTIAPGAASVNAVTKIVTFTAAITL